MGSIAISGFLPRRLPEYRLVNLGLLDRVKYAHTIHNYQLWGSVILTLPSKFRRVSERTTQKNNGIIIMVCMDRHMYDKTKPKKKK